MDLCIPKWPRGYCLANDITVCGIGGDHSHQYIAADVFDKDVFIVYNADHIVY